MLVSNEKDAPLEVLVMPNRQMKMRKTIVIGWSTTIYDDIDEPKKLINLMFCPSMGPKSFWTFQRILVEYQLFWSGPICIGQVQISKN